MLPGGKTEHPSGGSSQKEREDSYDAGMNAQFVPEQGKYQSDGMVKVGIDPLFRISRLQGSLKKFMKSCHYSRGFDNTACAIISPAMAGAIARRKGEKLGQSLKSMI